MTTTSAWKWTTTAETAPWPMISTPSKTSPSDFVITLIINPLVVASSLIDVVFGFGLVIYNGYISPLLWPKLVIKIFLNG
jgi:hypothetical protein